jgi:hypothetical protein
LVGAFDFEVGSVGVPPALLPSVFLAFAVAVVAAACFFRRVSLTLLSNFYPRASARHPQHANHRSQLNFTPLNPTLTPAASGLKVQHAFDIL